MGNDQILKTEDGQRWQEVSAREWDTLTESRREILLKAGGGIRFVKKLDGQEARG